MLTPQTAPEGGLDVRRLRCEALDSPLGLQPDRPRLSWQLGAGRRGARQGAYRVRCQPLPPGDLIESATRVGGSDIASDKSWDTGWLEGDIQQLSYAGSDLLEATTYRWVVEVRDEAGVETVSAPATFETGISASSWSARWIAHDSRNDPGAVPPQQTDRSPRTELLAPVPRLRRAFRLTAEPVRARLRVSARGLYVGWVNGHRVGDIELAPGWMDYRFRQPYQTYDVTDHLAVGENVLAFLLADGWWSGYLGFDARRPAQHYGRTPALLVQLEVDLPDGHRQIIPSDHAWTETPSEICFTDLLMGEYVDRRRTEPNWTRPAYDAGGWRPVRDAGDDLSTLVALPDHPVRVVEEIACRGLSHRPSGALIADFGQNLVGRVRLTLRGTKAGDRVQLRHGEALDATGELYTANLRSAESTDVFIAGDSPDEQVEPWFTVHGFRYVEVIGLPGLRAEDLHARVLHSDVEMHGRFECSDPDVAQLAANISWGLRGNLVGIPTDCPQRDERLGWLADAQVFLPTATYLADVQVIFARWMRDVVDGQDADGAFPDVAPRVVLDREGAPAWGDAGVLVPWTLYRTYGDISVLAASFPAMCRWVDHVHRANPSHLWREARGNDYGDWLELDAQTPHDLLATAYYARSTQVVADAASVLGDGERAQRYAARAVEIRKAFVSAYAHPDGSLTGGTQTAYCLALAFDLLPVACRKAAFAHLVADVESRGIRLTTGFLGVALICPVLTRFGRPDLAYGLLHQDAFPSWLYSVNRGATTVWERWDGWTEEAGFQSDRMNSFNHYALGSIGEWLFGTVAGICQAPESVGGRRFVLRPTPGGLLSFAKARTGTVLGPVECGWSWDGTDITVTVEVPVGATALVVVPADTPSVLLEGAGRLEAGHRVPHGAAGEPGEVTTGPGVICVPVGPGRWRFQAAWAGPMGGPSSGRTDPAHGCTGPAASLDLSTADPTGGDGHERLDTPRH